MNHRIQPSPMSNAIKHSGLTFGGRWGRPLAKWEDVKFFRSWLVYDSDLEVNRTRGRFNWNMVAGMAAMIAVSIGGWSGVVLVVRHFLR